jgi:hypothetical protein
VTSLSKREGILVFASGGFIDSVFVFSILIVWTFDIFGVDSFREEIKGQIYLVSQSKNGKKDQKKSKERSLFRL